MQPRVRAHPIMAKPLFLQSEKLDNAHTSACHRIRRLLGLSANFGSAMASDQTCAWDSTLLVAVIPVLPTVSNLG